MNTENSLIRSLVFTALATGLLLCIPLIAMQFSEEVVWTLSDFIIMGMLLFGAGALYQLVSRKSSGMMYKSATGLAVLTGLLLIWANLAVGIIGTEDNPINVFYLGVPAIALVSGLFVRFKPYGLYVSMIITALFQAAIAIMVLAGGYYESPPSSVIEIISINVFFILLWLASAALYRQASPELVSDEVLS